MIAFLLAWACSCGPAMDHESAVAFVQRERPDVKFDVDLALGVKEANLLCEPCGEPRPICGIVDAYIGAGWVEASCEGFRVTEAGTAAIAANPGSTPRRVVIGSQVVGEVRVPAAGQVFACDGDRHTLEAVVQLEADAVGAMLKGHGFDMGMRWKLSAPVQCAGGRWETAGPWVVQ